jgi:hypothetical protein
MTLNTLYLYQTLYEDINSYIKSHSSIYKECNFSKYLNSNVRSNFPKYLEAEISQHKINCLLILLDNCDASLDLILLNKLKDNYKLHIIFIFKNSQNSFEHIDRYYAQISCLTIIDDIPFIRDFYQMLEIETYTLFDSSPNQEILVNNIFSSELSNLSIKPNKEYKKQTIVKDMEQQFDEIFLLIKGSKYTSNQLLIDDKFHYAQINYKIYWDLFAFLQNNSYSIFKWKYIKYYREIFLLYRTMKKSNLDTSKPIDLINQALYKEYIL